MSKLKVKGRISYIPGPWGLNVRGKQLPVRIIDIHPIKGTRQTIWSGKTNNNGDFSGTTDDWRDIITVPGMFGVGPQKIPDPSDAMLLVIRIKEGGKWHEYPFMFIGDNIQSPVILPFPPHDYNPNHDRATLNGAEITDLQNLSDALLNAIQSKQPKITLKLYGNWANAAKPIVDIIRETPLKRVRRVFPNSQQGSIIIVAGGVKITITAAAILAAASFVIAIGAAILLTGAATMVVLLGIAVIIAVLMGYASINAQQKTTTNPNGTTQNEMTIELSLN